MTKIINAFIFLEILLIVITYFHLFKQYKYAIYCYDKQNKRKKIHISQRITPVKPRVTSNMTKAVNTDELNDELNSPILNFSIDGKKNVQIQIKKEKVFIGRSKSDDIVIDYEPTISRNHCFITKENDKYFINVDINKNPVSLNTKQIVKEKYKPFKKEISNGDIVSMGDGRISFQFVLSQDLAII